MKEIVGNRVLQTRSLLACGILRRLLRRVSLAKPTSAPLRFGWLRKTKSQFGMVGAFAEFERAILRERTKAGLDAARKRGCIGGRRPKLRPVQQDEIVSMVSMGTKTAADAARLFNVHPATVSRILARAGAGTIGVKVR